MLLAAFVVAGVLAGAAPAVAQDVSRDPDDILRNWNPGPQWTVSEVLPITEADLLACDDGVGTVFDRSDGAQVELYWVRCADPEAARAFLNSKWLYLDQADDLGYIWSPDIDRAAVIEVDGVRGVGRSWAEGNVYVYVAQTCPGESVDVCARSTRTFAREISAILSGTPNLDGSVWIFAAQAGVWFLLVPILTFILFIVPKRVVAWARSRGYSVASDAPDFTAVDGMVRRARAGRLARRIVLVVGTATIYLAGILTLDAEWWVMALWFFFAPFVIVFTLGRLLQLVWRPSPLVRVARRHTRLGVLGAIGLLVKGLASVIAAVAILIYVYASLIVVTDRASSTQKLVQNQIERQLSTGHPVDLFNASIRWFAHFLEDTGTFALLFVVLLAVPATVAYFVDRLGRRLISRGLQDTLEQDTRPYFLYLRGFDEDTLRIDESVGRRGLIEMLTPFGRPRFEELLVEYLNQFGPVIAISSSKQLIADLGAAKISFDDGQWQQHVAQWVAGARAVVMSATPREVRPGLEWEMEHLATSGAAKRLMLVLAPWPRAEIARRWQGFRDRASLWPLFRPLAEHPMPVGVHVMTWSPEHGWRGYGAKRRWDWTYAASILTAADRGDLGSDLAPGGTSAVEPHREKVTT